MPTPPVFPASPANAEEYVHEGRTFVYETPPGRWNEQSGALDPDLVALAAANNSATLVLTDAVFDGYKEADLSLASDRADEHSARLDNLEYRVTSGSTGQQVLAAVAGVNTIDLTLGTDIHVVSTAGAWTASFVNWPTTGAVVRMSINVTNTDDECLFVNTTYAKDSTVPGTLDWDAGETNIIRITRQPFVDKAVAEWIYNGATPDPEPTITPPTLTAFYSTSADLSSPVALGGATLPAGEVAIFFGPSGNTDIESFRIFCNLSGAVPAVGAENDSYVGIITTAPYKMRGLYFNETTGLLTVQDLWDTNVDPTGSNRIDYDPNGSTTITVQAALIDGQTVEATFTFNTANAPIGSTPTITHQGAAYSNANTSGTVTVADGVDRAVVLQIFYRVASSSQNISSVTVGGNAVTNIAAATHKNADLFGVWTGYITEASLSTGTLTIVPTYASTPGASTSIIYNAFVVSNVATPTFGGDYDYINTTFAGTATPSPAVVSVPANSILLTSASQENTTSTDLTCDIGTPTTTVTIVDKNESRASWLADSGASATETAVWTGKGKAYGSLVYLAFTASPGGEEVTPITPGTPVISSTVAADNQLTVTWGAAANAVSYELRHGTTNPPATTPIVGVTSPRVITGLAASVVRYVQVRAKSSTNTYSAWSTASSGTPTGTGTGGGGGSEKFIVSSNAFDCAYSQGNAPMRFSDLWIPTTTVRKNPASTETALSNMMTDANLDGAINNYLNRANGNSNAFIDAAGPRLIWTNKLGLGAYNHTKGTGAEAAQSVLGMGITGSTGSINRDWVWTKIANDLNRTYRGFNVYEMVYFSVAHESNGPWEYNAYMGRNPALIGQPALLQVTNAQFGGPKPDGSPGMADALRLAGTTGECSLVHRLAVEHVMDILWSIQPKIIIGMTPADGGSSTPEDIAPPNLGYSWVWDAFPRKELGYGLDFITSTIYARGDNYMNYDGSGSIDDRTNWTPGPTEMLSNTVEFIDHYGCAGGLLESGVAYALPGTTPGASGNNSQTDEGTRAFMQTLYEDTLPTIYADNILFVNHWLFANNATQKPNPGTNCSFHVLEAMWGNLPAGVTPTSTAKPTWSAQDGTRYVKTLDYLRSKF